MRRLFDWLLIAALTVGLVDEAWCRYRAWSNLRWFTRTFTKPSRSTYGYR